MRNLASDLAKEIRKFEYVECNFEIPIYFVVSSIYTTFAESCCALTGDAANSLIEIGR